MRGVGKWLGLSPIAALAFVLVLSGNVAASGSGYNQSFSQAASGSNANADMTAVSTNDPGGANVSVQFTVAGQVILNSDTYVYEVWFGGSTAGNATAYGIFSNNSTNGFYLGYGSNSGSYGNLPYTLSGGGSTLSFSIAKAILPPSSSFTLNAVAVYVSGSWYCVQLVGERLWARRRGQRELHWKLLHVDARRERLQLLDRHHPRDRDRRRGGGRPDAGDEKEEGDAPAPHESAGPACLGRTASRRSGPAHVAEPSSPSGDPVKGRGPGPPRATQPLPPPGGATPSRIPPGGPSDEAWPRES